MFLSGRFPTAVTVMFVKKILRKRPVPGETSNVVFGTQYMERKNVKILFDFVVSLLL